MTVNYDEDHATKLIGYTHHWKLKTPGHAILFRWQLLQDLVGMGGK